MMSTLARRGQEYRMTSLTRFSSSHINHFVCLFSLITHFLMTYPGHALTTGGQHPCTYDFELQTSTMRISCAGSPAVVNIYADTATLLTRDLLEPTSTSAPKPYPEQMDSSGTSAHESESESDSESENKTESESESKNKSKSESKTEVPELFSSRLQQKVWGTTLDQDGRDSFTSHVWNASRRLDETRRFLTGYSNSLESVSDKLAEGRTVLDNDMEKLKQTSKTPEELKQGIMAAMTNQFTFTRTLLLTRNQALQDLLGSLNTLVGVISDGMHSALDSHKMTLNRVDTINETLLSVRGLLNSELRKNDKRRRRVGKQGKKPKIKASCPKEISAIGAGTYRDMRSTTGTYMVQAGNPNLYGPVYLTKGSGPQDELEVYDTPQDVIFDIAAHYIPLPYRCSGTGHVVYRRHLYCHQHGTNLITKFHLKRYDIIADLPLPGAGYSNTFPYTSGRDTDVDLAVDELGLWAIYATNTSAGKVVISKIDHKTMELVSTWMTSYPKSSLGNAFMICGTLYATDSHRDVPTFIRYVYSTETGESQLLQPGEITFLNSALVGRPNVFGHARRGPASEKQNGKKNRSVHRERKPTLRERLNGSRHKRETKEGTRKNGMISNESDSVMLSYDFRTSSLLSWNAGRLETFPIYFREEDQVI